MLLMLAAVLALGPTPGGGPPTNPVLVAARDLPPGSTLRPTDLRTVQVPDAMRPANALRVPGQASGRVLAGAARQGEPLTDTRLVGPENTALTTGKPGGNAAAVPVRLADPAVAELLSPGARVDVVAQQDAGYQVLAENASVITAVAARDTGDEVAGEGRLVILALPGDAATRVAASSLTRAVTVTLR
ncbi:MAG: hypothetical protein GEU98_24170 [Pseudonocardiaceae bacterium]|nr:hypothetical protein [Pseudonocardiaceae bacterium]